MDPTPEPTPTPTPDPTPKPLIDADGNWREDWRTDPRVPEELRENQQLGTHKTLADTLTNWGSLHKRAGAHMLAVPPDGADDAAYEALYNELGRPKTADEYTLPDPVDGEGKPLPAEFVMPDETLKQVVGILHNAGLTQRQVDKLLPAWNGLIAGQLAEAQQQRDTRMATVKNEMGSAFEANQALVEKFVRSNVPEDEAQEVMQLAQTPSTFKLLHQMAVDRTEPNPDQTGAVPADVTAAAETQVAKLTADPAYTDRYHPNHQRVVKEVNELRSLIFAQKQKA